MCFVKRNRAFQLTGRMKNANLARSKARPVLRIIDRLIFLRVSEIPSNLPTILPIF